MRVASKIGLSFRSSGTEFQAKLCGKNGTSLLKSKLACPDSVLIVKPLQPDSNYHISYVTTVVGCAVCMTIDLEIILVYAIVWDKHSCYGWSIIVMTTSALVYYASSVLLFVARDQADNILAAGFSLVSIFASKFIITAVVFICIEFVYFVSHVS